MGTLYGRWPAAAVWASLLPLLDKNGVLDISMQAISGMTGWPLDLLEKGIQQLMEPDAKSRTPDHDGRRLVLLDEARPWGWRAVNHSKYREKARKQNYDAARTESGADAERKRASRAVPRSPDESRAVPLSDTNTNTDKTPLPPEGGFAEFWQAYPRKIRKAAAMRAWTRKGLSAKAAEILAHLAERVRSDAQWLKNDGEFIPYPATWLNGDGWLDEYEVAKGPRIQGL
jgi:hypothetical protein